MISSRLSLCVAFLGFAAFPSAVAAQAPHPSRVPLQFDHLYDYEEISKALHDLVRAYPDLLTIQAIGTSYEGRSMWLVTINNPKTGSDRDKPAMYIDGNIHGNEVQAAEVGLYTIWYLTKSYGHVEKLTELMDETAFYILPMVNPDGRAHWFNNPNTTSSSRSGKKPTDNDSDGLMDEDGYDDLDGDGEILEMRRLSPTGQWKDSPDDPRLMVFCKPGEQGKYERLGREGIDNDGDGRINEDGPGGYDMNRNWPADWQPGYIQYGAGDYPLYFPETRCIAAFIKDHPNIAAVQAYHNAGGMILRGPGAKYVKQYPRGDRSVYDYLGKEGEKMLPFYKYMIIWKDLYTVHGGFINWTAEHLGIFSFTNELWTGDKMFYKASKSGFFGAQGDRLKYNDMLLFGQTFRPWKPFKHPTYGDIELGGWVKYSNRVPPGFMLPELCHRNMAFTIFHAGAMPKLEFVDVSVKDKGDDVHEITVEIRNTHVIPTVAAIAAQKKIGARDYIEITPTGDAKIEVLAGGTLSDKFLSPLKLVEHQPWRIWNDGGISGLPSFGGGFRRGGGGGGSTIVGAKLFRWIVRGTGQVKVTYRSQKARTISKRIDLN